MSDDIIRRKEDRLYETGMSRKIDGCRNPCAGGSVHCPTGSVVGHFVTVSLDGELDFLRAVFSAEISQVKDDGYGLVIELPSDSDRLSACRCDS